MKQSTTTGAVDGTHVKIEAPSGERERGYVNRHHDHSINVQVAAGPNLEVFDVFANYPGSVHDARVFDNSPLRARLEAGYRPFPNSIMLGDSAYTASEYVIPPLDGPARTISNRHIRFNTAHMRTRRFVECSIGLAKQCFRGLLNGFRLKEPTETVKAIKTMFALHNLRLHYDPLTAPEIGNMVAAAIANGDEQETEDFDGTIVVANLDRRQQLINTFSNAPFH